MTTFDVASLRQAAEIPWSDATEAMWKQNASDLEAAADYLEEWMYRLQNWRDCYPEDVFIPLTGEQQKQVVADLKEKGWTPDALYAHWGRHIVSSLEEVLPDD